MAEDKKTPPTPPATGRKPPETKIVALVTRHDGKLQLKPCDKKQRFVTYTLDPANQNGAHEGDIVVAEKLQQSGNDKAVKVTRILGQKTSPGILSLISLYEKGLSEEFSQAALNETKGMAIPDLAGREDLRSLPLVTIDGKDTRDRDDAVYAEDLPDGGKYLIIAISDVSYFVQPGSELDKEAYQRGNSTYFPDRVVPMLPKALSNGLCSLDQHQDRPSMDCHVWIDKDGNVTAYKIARGLMRSAAALNYDQVQAAKDGNPDAVTAPLMDTVINPLYSAYEVLRAARERRGALDLNTAEHKVSVDGKGEITNVGKAARPESCKVIEEFMILANVVTATALEEKKAACVYRVHDRPPYMNDNNDINKDLREYIGAFGLELPPAGEIKDASAFKDVLKKARQIEYGHHVIRALTRGQAKAFYDTENIGHFGLALKKYGHFTSPIRRYADLLQHRSLVDAFNLGAGALDDAQKAKLQEMAEHISGTETLSAKAERSAHDRFAAAFLEKRRGHKFTGSIASITTAGLFVRLDGAGMDGLVLMRDLPKDYYDFDTEKKTLTGRNHGRTYEMGDSITVRIKEADALMGSVLLEAANDNHAGAPKPQQGPKPFRKQRGPRR